jgi:flavin reductase (DIM6/NTAB) family NADH-FMN oxidoreductase RutF
MKKPLGSVNCLYPMPVVLVGALVNDKPNYLTAAWVGIVGHDAICIASQRDHYTNIGIRQHRTFSANIPCEAQVQQTDYCGLVSGRDVDKSTVFESFYGQLTTAPMIASCPLNMECRVLQTFDHGDHEIFLGQIVQSYASDEVLTEGKVDLAKVKPILYEMGRRYWTLGQPLAKAWDVGKQLKL